MRHREPTQSLNYVISILQSATKLLKHYSQTRVTSENKIIHTPPFKVRCFQNIARTPAQHCMEGVKQGGKALFSLFTFLAKTLEQRVSTNFVADSNQEKTTTTDVMYHTAETTLHDC